MARHGHGYFSGDERFVSTRGRTVLMPMKVDKVTAPLTVAVFNFNGKIG